MELIQCSPSRMSLRSLAVRWYAAFVLRLSRSSSASAFSVPAFGSTLASRALSWSWRVLSRVVNALTSPSQSLRVRSISPVSESGPCPHAHARTPSTVAASTDPATVAKNASTRSSTPAAMSSPSTSTNETLRVLNTSRENFTSSPLLRNDSVSTKYAVVCRRRISVAERNAAGGTTVPAMTDSGWFSFGSMLPRPCTKASTSELPVRRPARPTRCTYEDTVVGSEASMTVDRSPMSMPISSVGVATSTFGAFGASAPPRNARSSARRSSFGINPVCSRATTARGLVEVYSCE